MRYLITGHTGFKGSWLSLMLKHQGHEVSGVSLNPDRNSLFYQASIKDIFEHDYRLDIRKGKKLEKAFQKISPEIVIHLAAQPLVRRSYLNPVETYETNVIGTLNVLEGLKNLPGLKSALIITTDKVYKNMETFEPYAENSPLGGDDPYSSSKAASDLLTQSWTKSFANFPIGIARAGNVIGGGDWAEDRLVPDLVRSYQNKEILEVRNPKSVRPWQHVLDCLNGYLALNNYLIKNNQSGCWNFGPEVEQDKTVEKVIDVFSKSMDREMPWNQSGEQQPHEAGILILDSKKAREELGWRDYLSFSQSIAWTANWYTEYLAGKNLAEFTRQQVSEFFAIASPQRK